MAQITYEDKVALYENEEIADINKCNASDMNEIKNAVNDNYNMIQNLKQVARTGNYNDLTNRPIVSYPLPSSSTAQWKKLGTVKLTGQAQQIVIKLYDGDGQNARPDQNMSMEIIIKRGYQASPSTSNIAGASYQINRFVAKNNIENLKVKVMCTDTSANLDIYVYFPWGYSSGIYTVYGNYNSYTHSGTAVGTTEPSTGTAQPCAGIINGLTPIATASLTKGVSSPNNAKISLDSIISNTNKLTLSNGGIKIGSGISKVLVNGNVLVQASANTGYLWTSIKKNNDEVSIAIDNQNTYFASTSHSPRLINVAENDIIYLWKKDAGAGNIRAEDNTYLTVQVVE